MQRSMRQLVRGGTERAIDLIQELVLGRSLDEISAVACLALQYPKL